MATISINSIDYDSYADEDFVGDFLAADIKRNATWAAGAADDQRRAIVSASREIAGQNWDDSAPSYDLAGLTSTQQAAIKSATAMLAADMLADPELADGFGAKREAKRVKAGPAEAEFFAQSARDVLPLPRSIWTLLAATDLIGSAAGAAHGEVYYGGAGLASRMPEQDYDWPDGIGGGG